MKCVNIPVPSSVFLLIILPILLRVKSCSFNKSNKWEKRFAPGVYSVFLNIILNAEIYKRSDLVAFTEVQMKECFLNTQHNLQYFFIIILIIDNSL